MEYNMCLVLIAEDLTPRVVLKHNVDDTMALQIASKTMSRIVSFLERYDEGEFVIGLPKEDVAVFSRYFRGKEEDKYNNTEIVGGTIIFITGLENQSQMHQDVPNLSKLTKIVIKNLRNLLELKMLDENSILEMFYTELSETWDFLPSEVKPILKSMITIPIQPNLNLWNRFVNSGIDRVIRALLIKEQVVFLVENQDQAQFQLANARLFCSQQSPQIVEWTMEFNDQAEIQCGDARLAASLPSNIVVFDELTEKIQGGQSNKFCLELFQDLLQLDVDNLSNHIMGIIDELLLDLGTLLSKLRELINSQEDNNTKLASYETLIKDFKNKSSKEELEIIEILMNQSDLVVMDRAKQHFSLKRTWVEVIQYGVMDKVGPIGRLIVEKALEEKSLTKYSPFTPENLQDCVNQILALIEPKNILSSEEIEDLRRIILREVETFRSTLISLSIFE